MTLGTPEAIRADYEAGMIIKQIAQRHSKSHHRIIAMVRRFGWERPKREVVLPEGVRKAYEGGVALARICADFGIGRQTLNDAAKSWRRPPRKGDHEAVRRDYEETGMSAEEIGRRHGYSTKSVTSMAAANGWRRNRHELAEVEQVRTDPLGDKLAALGFTRHVAPAGRSLTRAPTWVR